MFKALMFRDPQILHQSEVVRIIPGPHSIYLLYRKPFVERFWERQVKKKFFMFKELGEIKRLYNHFLIITS